VNQTEQGLKAISLIDIGSRNSIFSTKNKKIKAVQSLCQPSSKIFV
jgi:hypothetical protein